MIVLAESVTGMAQGITAVRRSVQTMATRIGDVSVSDEAYHAWLLLALGLLMMAIGLCLLWLSVQIDARV